MRAESQKLEELQGTIERITFQSEETGYSVIRVQASGHRDLVTVVGTLPVAATGAMITAQGHWTRHKEFGLQFQADSAKTSHPSTLEGMERYLGSGLVRGVGPHFAKKMIEAFGADIFEVLDNSPQRLMKVEGIGKGRIKNIIESWASQKAIRDIMAFLQSHHVSTLRATRIFKTYGAKAVEVVTQNPFRLARDIAGIGFKSADQIARNLGIGPEAPERIRAGIQFVLSEQTRNGHCAFPTADLVQLACELLQVSESQVQHAIETEIQDGYLSRESIDGTACVFTESSLKAEKMVAKELFRLTRGTCPWKELNAPKALEWVAEKLELGFAENQKRAVVAALTEKCLVITGGPGTGKTTITKAITTILSAKKARIVLCSPTGRAAKRLSECTGLEAKTIHRTLKVARGRAGFEYDEENPLPADLVLVDEASMIDIHLMTHLLKAIPSEASLILVGDVDQLPSVGPGQVLRDIIQSETLRVVKLTEIFRQAQMSDIIINAHRINQGELPELSASNSDFFFFSAETPEQANSLILDLVKNRIPNKFGWNSVKDIQVLCPMNRGPVGTQALNASLQGLLNPKSEPRIERYGHIYAPGDKVMVTENDYDKDVFNGDIGYVDSIDVEEKLIWVRFEDRTVEFEFSEMDILSLAYATTVHKAQGSEYPAVVIPVLTTHYMMLKKNLIYTAVTRGKKLVILVGQKKALSIVVNSGREEKDKRWTYLAQRLRQGQDHSADRAAQVTP